MTAPDAVLTRAQFLQQFKNLAAEFDSRKAAASQAEQAFFKALDACLLSVRAEPLADSRLGPGHELHGIVNEQAQHIRDVVELWSRKVRDRDTQAEFKRRKQDSLLVFVYGKVKAGKSSLGNYIAWGRHDPPPATGPAGPDEPAYFVETSRNLTERVDNAEISRNRKFKVGATETTSAIQGFTLPGLTWVDSPGLHSRTEENGALAQQYVDAADLVLYLTSSAAPCKRSDVMELKDLGRREHNLAVLITGSDMVEEDEGPDGSLVKVLAMKSAQDRDSQLRYTRKTLDEQGGQDGAQDTEAARLMGRTLRQAQVLSLSVAYAEQHPDAQGMALSGVGQMLHGVAGLARSHGVRAKLVQPLKNLRSFLHQIQDADIPALRQSLDDCQQAVGQARATARREAEVACKSIALDIDARIDTLLARHAMDNDAFKRKLRRQYGQWLDAGMKKACEAYVTVLETSLPAALDDVTAAIPDFKTLTKSTRRKTGIRSRQGAVVGALLLGAATLLTGGGAAVSALVAAGGGMLGSAVGGRLGALLDDEEWVDVPVGDNAWQVGASARKLLRQRFENQMRQVMDGLEHACFESLLQWIAQQQRQAQAVGKTTRHLLDDLDQRIAAHDAGA